MGPKMRKVGGLLVVLLLLTPLVGDRLALRVAGAPTRADEQYAEIVSLSGTAWACPHTVGCTTGAAKGDRVYATGEARTGPSGRLDLRSRTTAFQLQGNADLQLQDVTNAIQRLVLKAGRLFISHDPQGRDMIVVQAGKKQIEALDTTFSVVVTDTATADDEV